MLNYFDPLKEQSLLEKRKATALKWIMVSVFLLMVLLIVQSFITQENWTTSDYFLPVGQAFVVSILFILRYRGLQIASNVFSIGAVLIMTIVINIFDEDTIFTKYTEEFYLAIFVLVFISLFASRRILIVSALIFFLSSLRAFTYLQETFPEQEAQLREAQIFFSFTLVNISLILYFVTRFSDRALETAQKDAKIKEEQNAALIAARQQIEQSELTYRSIVNNLVGGFYKTDANGTIVLVSPSTTKITGFTEDRLLGESLSLLFSRREEYDFFLSTMKSLGKVGLYKAAFNTKEDGPIFIETNATAVYDEKNVFSGVEGIFYDVSAQRKMELELENYRNNLEDLVQEKTEDLKQAQSQLVQAEKMASLGILTAGVAHEINNPLNFIMGSYVGLKRHFEEGDQENVEALLNALEIGVTRATDIVKGLTQFSRSKETNDDTCDIHSIIDNCLLILKKQYENEITINKQYDKGGLKLLGNLGKLHQVFMNILTNSIHAIDDKGEITISTKSDDGEAIIEITDTGVGISKENLTKITDPFFTTKAPGKGTGLGLSITYSIIKDHQGDIEFVSEKNKGTTVAIRLPVELGNSE